MPRALAQSGGRLKIATAFDLDSRIDPRVVGPAVVQSVFGYTAGLVYFTQAYDIGERREFFIGGAAPALLKQAGLGLTDDESRAAFGEISWTLSLFGRNLSEESFHPGTYLRVLVASLNEGRRRTLS